MRATWDTNIFSGWCYNRGMLRNSRKQLPLTIHAAVCGFSHVRLFNPTVVNCQAPLSMQFSRQARTLEWVAISSSRGSSWLRDQTLISLASPALAGRLFTTEPPGKTIISFAYKSKLWSMWQVYLYRRSKKNKTKQNILSPLRIELKTVG